MRDIQKPSDLNWKLVVQRPELDGRLSKTILRNSKMLFPRKLSFTRAFNQDNIGCWGGIGTLGFGKEPTTEEKDHLVDFLTNVERYKKTEEQVIGSLEANPPLPAQGKYLIFKRWDLLTATDQPQVVSFFCTPDAIAGLHCKSACNTDPPLATIGIQN